MKTKDKEKEESKQGHENQNIRDFNRSQFVEDEEIDTKKIKKKNKKKEEDKKKNK